MSKGLDIAISGLIVLAITILIGRYVKISNKYDRKPRKPSTWQSQDQGDDPTEDEEK